MPPKSNIGKPKPESGSKRLKPDEDQLSTVVDDESSSSSSDDESTVGDLVSAPPSAAASSSRSSTEQTQRLRARRVTGGAFQEPYDAAAPSGLVPAAAASSSAGSTHDNLSLLFEVPIDTANSIYEQPNAYPEPTKITGVDSRDIVRQDHPSAQTLADVVLFGRLRRGAELGDIPSIEEIGRRLGIDRIAEVRLIQDLLRYGLINRGVGILSYSFYRPVTEIIGVQDKILVDFNKRVDIIVLPFFASDMKLVAKLAFYIYLINGPIQHIIDAIERIDAPGVQDVGDEADPSQTLPASSSTEATQDLVGVLAQQAEATGGIISRDHIKLVQQALAVLLLNLFTGSHINDDTIQEIQQMTGSISRGLPRLFMRLMGVGGNDDTPERRTFIISVLRILQVHLTKESEKYFTNTTLVDNIIGFIRRLPVEIPAALRTLRNNLPEYVGIITGGLSDLGRIVGTFMGGSAGVLGSAAATVTRGSLRFYFSSPRMLARFRDGFTGRFNRALELAFEPLIVILQETKKSIREDEEAAASASMEATRSYERVSQAANDFGDLFLSLFRGPSTSASAASAEPEILVADFGNVPAAPVPDTAADVPATASRQSSSSTDDDDSDAPAPESRSTRRHKQHRHRKSKKQSKLRNTQKYHKITNKRKTIRRK